MFEIIFVWMAFILAGAVCVISLLFSFFWLPRKMERVLGNALRTLATAVETKDSRTLGHAERVAEMVSLIAEDLNLPSHEIKRARYAALLRDIGKVAVPHRILNKESSLTSGEARVVHKHVKEGSEIVKQVPLLAGLSEVILHHHERWDGSGYPDGLKEGEIPLISRIIGLVDDYEAMISERPYHPAMDEEEATRIIMEGAGTLYDPRVVDSFIKIAGAVTLKEAQRDATAA